MEIPISNQTLLHELAPDLNPAGVEASMRLHYGILDHLPRETFVAQAKLAADLEGQSRRDLRKIADGMGMTELPTPRAGTKQAMLIALLQAPEGATMDEIVAATGWLAHTARSAMSGALGKKLGLVVTSEKDATRGRVYRLPAA